MNNSLHTLYTSTLGEIRTLKYTGLNRAPVPIRVRAHSTLGWTRTNELFFVKEAVSPNTNLQGLRRKI